MKKMLKAATSPLVWLLLILIAYFSSDIIDRGIILNQLTPIPFFGWAMWIGIFFVVWWLFLQPLYQFCYMLRPGKTDLHSRAKAALKFLRQYENKPDSEENQKLYEQIDKLTSRPVVEGSKEARDDDEQLEKLLNQYYATSELRKAARTLVLRYSKITALGVVFSRNNLMDGVIMLVLQMKLIVALAKLYGYKPSPVFNTICFGWVLANSATSALLAQDAAEMAGESAGSLFSESMVDLFSGEDELASIGIEKFGKHLSSAVVSSLLEAIMAGASVYVTGSIFIRKLERDGGKLSFQELITLRRKARLELGRSLVTEVVKEVGKKTLNRINPLNFLKSRRKTSPEEGS